MRIRQKILLKVNNMENILNNLYVRLNLKYKIKKSTVKIIYCQQKSFQK